MPQVSKSENKNQKKNPPSSQGVTSIVGTANSSTNTVSDNIGDTWNTKKKNEKFMHPTKSSRKNKKKDKGVEENIGQHLVSVTKKTRDSDFVTKMKAKASRNAARKAAAVETNKKISSDSIGIHPKDEPELIPETTISPPIEMTTSVDRRSSLIHTESKSPKKLTRTGSEKNSSDKPYAIQKRFSRRSFKGRKEEEDGPEMIPETVTASPKKNYLKPTDEAMAKAKAAARSYNDKYTKKVKAGNKTDRHYLGTQTTKIDHTDFLSASLRSSTNESSNKHGSKQYKYRENPGEELKPPAVSSPMRHTTKKIALNKEQVSFEEEKVEIEHEQISAPRSTPPPLPTRNIYDEKKHIAERSRGLHETHLNRRNADFREEAQINEDDTIRNEDECSDRCLNVDEDSDIDMHPGAVAVGRIKDAPRTAWQSTFNILANTIGNQDHTRKIPEDNNIRDTSEHLIKAVVVDDTAIPQAEAVSEETLNRKRRRCTLFCCFALVAIITSIVLANVLTRDGSVDPTPSLSSIPSSVPSMAPSSNPTSNIRQFLDNLSPTPIEALDDPDTPQAKALIWIENDYANTDISAYDDERKVRRFVLATLYYSTGGDQWIDANGWLSAADECTWAFVSCSGFTSVFENTLSIKSNRLAGPLPPEIYLLTGLTTLDLSDNVINGQIPSEVGLMGDLQILRLDGNGFIGSLPTELGLLSASLREISLWSNNIAGSVSSYIGFLTNLESFGFNDNVLSGTIPSFIGVLSKLTSLSFADNTLSGPIPSEILSLQDLQVLDLSDNLFIGSIPFSKSGNSAYLSNLKKLHLESNFITGTISSSIGMMERIQEFALENNRLTGTIPTEMGKLSQTVMLDLSYNYLSGSIPSEISSLGRIETLNLARNSISGSLPEDLTMYSNLRTFNLYRNRITGVIPSSARSMVNLVRINLFYNRLNGTIPEYINLYSNLVTLDLGFNSLTGIIPETIGSLVHLESLFLHGNYLTSSIPTSIGNMKQLVKLHLQSNDFSGIIPETIGSLVHLESLFLHGNSLTGSIPTSIGNMEQLVSFSIESNDLTGNVPDKLCELRQNNDLFLYLDCDKISCDCCFDWCQNPPRIPNSTASLNCTDGTSLLQVAVGTDRNPQGVEWDVIDESSNETLLQGGPLSEDDKHRTIMEEACITNDACLVFTVRGWNDEGSWYYAMYDAGDRFMVHLNGSEISNGRFQDFQDHDGFGFSSSRTSCVTTDRYLACSLDHPTCDTISLECSLDNIGGVSGFCRPKFPSTAPSMSQMPSTSLSPSQTPSTSPAPSTSPIAFVIIDKCAYGCEFDEDCEYENSCYMYPQGESVEDCSGVVSEGVGNVEFPTGYCREPPDGTLVIITQEDISGTTLQKCQGDCDLDKDCAGNLKCFLREGSELVPGCDSANDGIGWFDHDYCYNATGFLHFVHDGLPEGSYGLCEGDCDSDADCIGDLVCYNRDGGEDVPGCNDPYNNITVHESIDFCCDPNVEGCLVF